MTFLSPDNHHFTANTFSYHPKKSKTKAKQPRFLMRALLSPPDYIEHNLYKMYIISQNY